MVLFTTECPFIWGGVVAPKPVFRHEGRSCERCSQYTVVVFSLVSLGNMAKQFESSLLD